MIPNIRDDIYILRKNAKYLDEAITECPIPKDAKFSADLKVSLSRLYEFVVSLLSNQCFIDMLRSHLTEEAEYFYGIKKNSVSEDSDLFLKGIHRWNHLIKEFTVGYLELLVLYSVSLMRARPGEV